MKLDAAIKLFRGQVEKAMHEGYSIESVEAEPGGDNEILITATSPDDSVLVAVGVDRQDLLMRLVEYVFVQEARQKMALHKLEQMPTVQQSFPA